MALPLMPQLMPPPRPVMPPPQPAWGPPPPGFPPPPGYRPYPLMPPPRRKNNGPIVALVLFGTVLLGVGTIGIIAATRSDRVSDAGYAGYSSASPTYTYSATTTTTTDTTAPSATTASKSTSTTPSKPPGPQAVYKLGDHPLFRGDLGTFDVNGCALPKMDYSPAGEDRFLQAALPCIEAMWKPVFQRTELPYQPVELQVFTGTTQTPCGSRQNNATAMYCRGVIYWPGGFYANEAGMPPHPGKYLGQLGHEYGHHIQWLSGMLKAADNAQYDAGGWDTRTGLELNRRKELQATCFGGMTLAPLSHGAIPLDVVNEGLSDASNRGDGSRTPDHGSTENNGRWVMHGHKTNRTNACNTWMANAADVA